MSLAVTSGSCRGVQAPETGIEPKLVPKRIAELRAEKEALDDAWPGLGAKRDEAVNEKLTDQAVAEAPRTRKPSWRRATAW